MKRLVVVTMIVIIASITSVVIGCGNGDEEPTPTPTLTTTPQPTPVQTPIPAVTVSIDAFSEVDAGKDFSVKVTISEVADFDSYRFNVNYDPAVIRVIGTEGDAIGVKSGVIGTTTVPVDIWGFAQPSTQGTIRVLGNVPGVVGLSGSGYLAEIRFHVVGMAYNSSDITLSEGWIGNYWEEEIKPVTWVDSSVHVVGL